MTLTHQSAHIAKSQPPSQANGDQHLVDFEQYFDLNGNQAAYTDAWGNSYAAARSEGFKTITASATGIGSETDATPDNIVYLNANSITYTLPPAALNKGKRITVKLIAATATGTVNGGGVNIDGASTYSLSAQYKFVTVHSNGVQWFIIASN